MVHQHFMLVPVMTVAENLVLGAEPRNGPLLDYKAAARRTRELSERFGLAVDPDAKVEDLGVGAQQRVEILRALFRGAKVLVLDEPTAVLTAQESQDLFEVLRALKADGTGVVFISHKLNEVLEASDRVTVLRRGEKIDTVQTEGSTERSLARLMVGRDVLLRVEKPKHKRRRHAARARRRVGQRRPRAARRARRLAHGARWRDRRPGGRRRQRAERADRGDHRAAPARTGARSGSPASDVTGTGPRERQEAGLGHIAEDRHRRGLVLEFNLAENLALGDHRDVGVSRFGWLSPNTLARARRRAAQGLRRARRPTAESLASSLSGGNQQKVVIAREMSADPHVLIAAQPTRGLDVGAIEFVHRRLVEAARRGSRDPARVTGDGGDPLAQRPRARDLRGCDRGRDAAVGLARRTSAW